MGARRASARHRPRSTGGRGPALSDRRSRADRHRAIGKSTRSPPARGHGPTFDANAGLDLNYGAVKDVQLTATLPLSFVATIRRCWHAARAMWSSGSNTGC